MDKGQLILHLKYYNFPKRITIQNCALSKKTQAPQSKILQVAE
jgi:hypothetical protein